MEKLLARIRLKNTEAHHLCEQITRAIAQAGMQADLIVNVRTGAGEQITSMDLVEDDAGNVTLVLRLS